MVLGQVEYLRWMPSGFMVGAMETVCMYTINNLLGEKVKVLGQDLEKENMPGYFYTSSGRVIKEDVSDMAWDIVEEIINECQ